MRRGGRRRFYGAYGYGYLPGYFPYDYPDGYEQEAPPPEPPPAKVVFAYPPQPPTPPAPPVESLLLEYRNGQWVRVPTGAQTPAGPLTTQPSAQAPGARPSAAAGQESAQAPAVLRKTVLVFRDGHKEEVNKYVIEGNVLYASTDYWSTGSWTKTIPLSELNVPATVKLNQARGVKFELPSGPNEVVIGF